MVLQSTRTLKNAFVAVLISGFLIGLWLLSYTRVLMHFQYLMSDPCGVISSVCSSPLFSPSGNWTYPALLLPYNIMGKLVEVSRPSSGRSLAGRGNEDKADGLSGKMYHMADGRVNSISDGTNIDYEEDKWPVFNFHINSESSGSQIHRGILIKWDFNTSTLLQRKDVQKEPAKIMTWMVKTGYMPSLPEPVRLRFCPEMPCRMTTNQTYAGQSSALMWNAPNIRAKAPPVRAHPDQVFVFHNQECQTPDQTGPPTFHSTAWRTAFNWTMTYRLDSDILAPYGLLVKRRKPLHKNYTAILANKTGLVGWMVSHCQTHGQREQYVAKLKHHVSVHVFGACGDNRCARSHDAECLETLSSRYKFLLAFENSLCQDYVTEKFFRYMEADAVLVVRGGSGYQHQAPAGLFINTADFRSVKDLADYLLYLDSHAEEYVKILKAKDEYVALYEDYTHIVGGQPYVHYQYEAIAYCEICRRLWNLDKYRKNYPDIDSWFAKGNCYPPNDLE